MGQTPGQRGTPALRPANIQPVQVDEDATEEQLRERRAAQVKGFKLNRREDDEPDVPQREEEPLDYDPNTVNEDLRFALGDERFVEHDTYVGDYLNDEYESAELDAERIEYALESKVRFTFITSIIQAVLHKYSLWRCTSVKGNIFLSEITPEFMRQDNGDFIVLNPKFWYNVLNIMPYYRQLSPKRPKQ